MTEQLEYVGDMQFSSCDLKTKATMEDWLRRAREEFAMKDQAVAILNMNDEQLERYARTLGSTDEECCHAFMDLADWIADWKHRYEDATKMADATAVRMVVVAERLAGRKHIEETYRQN